MTVWDTVEIAAMAFGLLCIAVAVYFVFFSPIPDVGQIRKMAKRYLKKYPKTNRSVLHEALRQHMMPEAPPRSEDDDTSLLFYVLLFRFFLYILISLTIAMTRGLMYLKYLRHSKQLENRIQRVLDELYGDE